MSQISGEKFCLGRKYGNTIELTTAVGHKKPAIKKLNDDEYMVCSTGEIKEYQKNKDKTGQSNLHNVRATFRKLRRLIAVNFDGVELRNSALWITLTYAELMQSPERLKADFKQFMAKLAKFWHVKRSDLCWISAVECQASGSLHVHLLIKFKNNRKRMFIPNSICRELWGQGFVNVQRIKSTKNNGLSRYLSAYLTDLSFDENIDEVGKGLFSKDTHKKSKKVIKGARLSLYKKNMNIIRHSLNIPQAAVKHGNRNEILKFWGMNDPVTTFYKHFEIERENSDPFDIEVEYCVINT